MKIKYVEIEFANQPILLPGTMDDKHAHKHRSDDFMDIDARDVKKEQSDYEFFEGYLIPLEVKSMPENTSTIAYLEILREYGETQS